MMNDTILDRLFSGDLDKSVQLPKRVVRLFISSTFTDMTLERNSLMERVYPRLKKYCRERYGLDFQVVDMRWGVRDEATDDHQTVNLCSREIQNCQRMSLGPNFVALLGDKYGFRPLCNRIKSTEYRALRRCLIELDINTDFLDTWYKEDLNAVPPEYLLQPISSILKNFTNKNEPELQSMDQRIWTAIQERLHELLMIGSSRLVKQGRMSEQEQLMKYSISVTEREVIEGCLDLKDAKSHCLVYVRSIHDLGEHLSKCLESFLQPNDGLEDEQQQVLSIHQLNTLSPNQEQQNKDNNKPQATLSLNTPSQRHQQQRLKKRDSRKASLKICNDTINLKTNVPQTAAERRIEKTRKLIARYIDLSSDNSSTSGGWHMDEEAQKALAYLKEVKLKEKLINCKRNLTEYRVAWHEKEGISLKSEEHKYYINDLTEHFYTNMTRMIRRASKTNEQTIKTGLIGEVLQHLHYAKHVSKTFYGRGKELNKIRLYILSSSSSDGPPQQQKQLILPMFIYGVGGSGKTSIMARASTLACDWISKDRTQNVLQIEERWDQRPCIISRFCGTTPNSSSIVGVLTSVCRQLQFNFYQYGPLNGAINQNETSLSTMKNTKTNNVSRANQSVSSLSEELKNDAQLAYQAIPEDFVRLVFTFRKLLDNCQHPFHKQRLFIIILDSVERLTSPAESSIEVKYSWLTSLAKLPENVRLIVSCSSERTFEFWREDYKHLKRHFLKSYFNLIKPSNDVNLFSDYSTNTGERGASPSREGMRINVTDDETTDEDESNNFSNNRRVDYLSNKFFTTSSQGPLSSASGNNVSNNNNSQLLSGRPTALDRYQLLKRVLVPAVRLMQQLKSTSSVSRNNFPANTLQKPKSPNSVLSTNRWSISGSSIGKRRNVINKRIQNEHLDNVSIGGDLGSKSSFSFEQSINSSAPNSPYEVNDKHGNGDLESALSRLDDFVWILHVRPMGIELAINVLRRWLMDVGRNLTQQQWSIVERSFSHCSRPIFVKLAFNEIVNWKSYSMQSNTKGLTFGSSLLEIERQNLLRRVCGENSTNKHSELDLTIRRLLEDSGENDAQLSETDQFKWQILTMEQQWLNYLDYKQREDQKSLTVTSSNGNDTNGGTSGQKNQEVIIRVGVGPAGGGGIGGAATAAVGHSSALAASVCHLSNTIDDAICQLFARIELQHGFILTKHSLSYITAARNGICENELEDILSLDDVVLDDVFQYHLPPVRRIPPLLWTRIRNDLPDYLSERDADGIVINWHHSQFKHVTQNRYLTEVQQVFYIHSNMADYFLGKWADKAKPFKCTKQQIQMAAEQLESAVQQSIRDSQTFGSVSSQQQRSSFYGGRPSLGSVGRQAHGPSFSGRRLRSSQQDQRFQVMQAKANRRVPHQPLYYTTSNLSNTSLSGEGLSGGSVESIGGAGSTGGGVSVGGGNSGVAGQISAGQFGQDGRRRYNIRKLTELPYHLMKSGRFQDLANNVFFNYKWLFAAIDALGLQYLLADFDEACKSLEYALQELEQQQQPDGKSVVTFEEGFPTTFSSTSSGAGLRFTSQIHEQDFGGVSVLSELDFDPKSLRSSLDQLNVLNNTIRLSCSSIHSDTQMLAPQLIGRLLPLVRQAKITNQQISNEFKFLIQLLDQCDKDGCADCALLPTDHCLQSPDGLQLSSLEGHSFAIMSMSMALDQRHLLAVSNRFIMWDITTGEVSRDIDPKIGGSIMKELKMGLNNEYAVTYTSNNVILVLDILTQQVTKYNEFKLDNNVKLFNNIEEPDGDQHTILGLDLIDKFGAVRFVVWTRRRWFVLRVVNNELSRSVSMSERITIEMEYSVDMSDIEFRLDRILSVQLLANANMSEKDSPLLKEDGNGLGCSDLAFVIFNKENLMSDDEPVQQNSVQMITLEASKFQVDTRHSQQDDWVFQVWGSRIEAQSICLDVYLRQLVYADSSGDVFLSRRRQTSWSKPKLLFSTTKHQHCVSDLVSNFSSVTSSAVPLEIELDNQSTQTTSTSQYLDPLFLETSSSKRIQLAKFERQIDSQLINDNEIEANCVFKLEETNKLEDNQQKEAQNKFKKRKRILLSSLSSQNQQPVKVVKLYLNDRIVVIRLDLNSSENDKSHQVTNHGTYQARRLMFPKNIRNISVEPNRSQIKSIIMSVSESKGLEYLVAAVGKRLLLYSLNREEFLKLVDAHSARIVQLIPILGQRNTNILETNNRQQGAMKTTNQQLAIASASMDKTVKIWNLLNVDKDIHNLDNLDGSIESMSIALQRPLVACISRGQVGVWDWRTLKLLARITHSDLQMSAATRAPPESASFLSSTRPKLQEEEEEGEGQNNEAGKSGQVPEGKIVACKFSANSRYLCLSTLDSIYLFALDGFGSLSSNAGEKHFSTSSTTSNSSSLFAGETQNSKNTCDIEGRKKLNLKLAFKQTLPEPSLVRRLKFFQQDSRVLSVLQCRYTISKQQNSRPFNKRQSTEEGSSSSEQTNSLSWRLTCRLLILCHSIPDGRLLFRIETFTPTMQLAQDSHYLGHNLQNSSSLSTGAGGSMMKATNSSYSPPLESFEATRLAGGSRRSQELIANDRIRLPVLTKDTSSVVCVEYSNTSLLNDMSAINDELRADTRRKSSGVLRIPLILNIYSTRDGLLLHSINLSSLEMFNPQQLSQQQLSQSFLSNSRKPSLPAYSLATESKSYTLSSEMRKESQDFFINQASSKIKPNNLKQGLGIGLLQQQQQQISITGDQFSRLKSVKSFQNERQSIIALLDNDRGSSFLIDVQTKQLLTCSNLWNGQISSDGRFGLSRMFKSAALHAATGGGGRTSTATLDAPESSMYLQQDQTTDAAQTPGRPLNSSFATTAGLRLLEMRRCIVVRSLLTNEMLSKLATTDIQTTGSDTDITCGFTRPNDAYVYFYSSRLKRLLLVRLCDGELIANYKLSSARVTKIKCSPDGYALILGLSDGSLTTLAVVDPLKSDTLARLMQYPSRTSQ